MYFVDNHNITDPRLNLALEEYLLRHVTIDEPLFLLYVNEPSVIVGRNQNILEEVDVEYAQENGVHVIRRLSGGGTVYHDLGNFNFSFISPTIDDLRNFKQFTGPIVRVLNELGVPAEFRNQSDLFVSGKKISGNAQFSSRGRMFSHGTILFDSDLPHLRQAIRPMKGGISSKAVQSNRSPVVNIRDFLHVDLTREGFKDALIRGIFQSDQIPTFEVETEAWEKIDEMAQNRYHKWEWNIGGSPRFRVERTAVLGGETVTAQVEVHKGHIQALLFQSGSSSGIQWERLATHFIGARYARHDVLNIARMAEASSLIESITALELTEILY